MTWEIRQGDCLELLRAMPDATVQTVVTSPPYWGLRDYGTASWEGGDSECDHILPSRADAITATASSTLGGGKKSTGHQQEASYASVCGKCGAKRIDSQLGLEPTPQEYVQNLVNVFREVRRVLRDDGTVWLNLGDSYAANGRYDEKYEADRPNRGAISALDYGKHGGTGRKGYRGNGIKAKDLVGIPWRVAFALQADGWYLRSDIIWAKANPMPESVTDRPTRSHEYIFLLTKSARYFYDADAVREGAQDWGERDRQGPLYDGTVGPQNGHTGLRQMDYATTGRNKRSVWTVTTQPYSEAHFATFPPKLIEPCILAGSAPGDMVVDPFAGSGTTGMVALRHDRSFIGLELNPTYVEMARWRIRDDAPLLNTGLEAA